ncbi:ferrous iron transport protein B [candidate division KSB1 bacterium]|nr:ferrous iron transport protein B [candidate division KSB1 bacterium]
MEHPQIVLTGQPNCGKSTLFNEVAGYKSAASNFPGATVTYTQSHVNLHGEIFDIVDLPGIYSLTSMDQAATESQRYLLTHQVDVIINVVDASTLSRSLELTLQLMDLEIPMVLCLNMIDEAERKGIQIDIDKLSNELGIPVVATVASHGQGVRDLFRSAFATVNQPSPARHIRGNRDVELVIAKLTRQLKKDVGESIPFSIHLLATKLLEGDQTFIDIIQKMHPHILPIVEKSARALAQTHGKPAHEVINAERHAMSMSLFEKVATFKKPKIQLRDRVDDVLMHSFWGYLIMAGLLYLFFHTVFSVGALLETPILNFFEGLKATLLGSINPDSLIYHLLSSAIEGIAGGVAIVLPYLLPFLAGLAFLEDVGYLPRVAFLMDAFMHRVGLHGTAVIPAVLGYGCNVPAVMATRILSSSRDRYIAAVIATLVPCAARMTIIFGLVGVYLGGTAAFGIYVLNFLVIVLSAGIMSRLLPEETPGMVLEIPVYHWPSMRSLVNKTWFRLKEFIVIAWPLLIGGSVLLALADAYGWSPALDQLTRPVTWLLGLPKEVGMTLLFGILRKELSMLMLFQALGTRDVITVLSWGQILVFTIFVVFYVPCVATIGALIRQLRARRAFIIVVLTFILALILALLTRGFVFLIG